MQVKNIKKIKYVEAVFGFMITDIITVPIIKNPIACVYFLPKILNSVKAPTIKFDGRAIELIIIFSINIVLVRADLSDYLTFSKIKFNTNSNPSFIIVPLKQIIKRRKPVINIPCSKTS